MMELGFFNFFNEPKQTKEKKMQENQCVRPGLFELIWVLYKSGNH